MEIGEPALAPAFTAGSSSESPTDTGLPVAGAALDSGGNTAGRLRWMLSRPAGAWRAVADSSGPRVPHESGRDGRKYRSPPERPTPAASFRRQRRTGLS